MSNRLIVRRHFPLALSLLASTLLSCTHPGAPADTRSDVALDRERNAKLCEKGWAQCCWDLAQSYQKSGERGDAIKYYTQACALGYPGACDQASQLVR